MNSVLTARLRASRPVIARSFLSAARLKAGFIGVVGALLVLPSLGCSSAVFITKVRRANEHFEQAKAVGAERYSPYEYYAAEARLRQSKQLAAEAEYGSAIKLADQSNDLAEQAIKNTSQKRAKTPLAPKGPAK